MPNDPTWTVKCTINAYPDGCRQGHLTVSTERGQQQAFVKLPLDEPPETSLASMARELGWWGENVFRPQLLPHPAPGSVTGISGQEWQEPGLWAES